MKDDFYYDKELTDYFKTLEHDPEKYVIYKTKLALCSAYYPKWWPERIDKDLWKNTVKETVLRMMMIEDMEVARKMLREELKSGTYQQRTWECGCICHVFGHKHSCDCNCHCL